MVPRKQNDALATAGPSAAFRPRVPAPFPLRCVAIFLAIAFICRTSTAGGAAPWWGDDPPFKDGREPTTRKADGKETAGKPGDKKANQRGGGGDKIDMSDIPADEKKEKKALDALSDLAGHFKIKHTMHFSVLYDTNDEDVGAFGAAVEKTYRSCLKFSDKLSIDVKLPKRKLLIHYFNELTDYSAHAEKCRYGKKPENVSGFYAPNANMSYFYNFRNSATFKRMRAEAEAKIKQLGEQARRGGVSAAERKRLSTEIKRARALLTRMDDLGGETSEQTIQHEVAHQVLWNIGFHNSKLFQANPRWLAEGMAQLFEPASTGKAANVGLVNQNRLRAFQQLVQAGKLVPLREFISTPTYFNSPEVAYPESWALVHYLSRVRGDELKEFVRSVNQRPKDYLTTPEDEVATFEKAFGKIDDRWIANWLKWIEKVR